MVTKQERINLVNEIGDYILSEIYDLERELLKGLSKLGQRKVNFASKDFEEMEQIMLTCREYVDFSTDRIEFMKLDPKGRYEVVDLSAEKYEFRLIENERLFEIIDGVKYEIDQGFYRDSNYLFDEIDARIDSHDPLPYEKQIHRNWVSDTINYHVYGSYKNSVLKIYLELKEYYNEEYDLYKNNNIIQSHQIEMEKLNWNSSISDLGYIFRNLCDLGYIEMPKDKNRKGFDDLKTIARILLNNFEVKGGIGSLKKMLQRKTNKVSEFEATFNSRTNQLDEKDIFMIPNLKKNSKNN